MNHKFALRRAALAVLSGAVLAAPFALTVTSATAIPQDIRVQHDLLADQLGGQFAGTYLDDSGALVVNVTDDSAAREARAAGATARVVDDSLRQLQQVQAGLDRFAGSPGTVGLSWGVDIVSNSVVVQVPAGDNDADTTAFLKRVASNGEDVRIERVAAAPRLTLAPGDAIFTGGARCSTSAIGVGGGGTFVITAGHCTNIGAQWTASGGQVIGTRSISSFPGNDYGTIRVTNAALPTTNGQLTQVGSPPVGSQIQKVGSTTGTTSGQIVAYNRTVNLAEGALFGMIETTACVQPGDSGGSLFQGSTAIGITSAGTVGGCSPGFQSFFQPLQEALSAQGVSLK